MLKNKTIKLFLIMSVVIFSIVGTVGCTNNEKNNSNINENYNLILKHFDLTDEKIIWNGDINDFYVLDDSVIVTLKKTDTYPELDLAVFGLDNAVHMEYLDSVTKPNNIANPERWRQKIIIYLKAEGKEKLLETIRKLEQLEFVKSVNPNVISEGT